MMRPVGALEQWHAELEAGLRTRFDFDALYRAACKEAEAAEFAGKGLARIANELRREAARIIVEGAKRDTAA